MFCIRCLRLFLIYFKKALKKPENLLIRIYVIKAESDLHIKRYFPELVRLETM